MLLVVDLPVAVAQAKNTLVGSLSDFIMRRISDLHPGETKADAHEAAIIVQAARTFPHALRSIQLTDEQAEEISILCGFDNDVLGQIVATRNRIRGHVTQISPAL